MHSSSNNPAEAAAETAALLPIKTALQIADVLSQAKDWADAKSKAHAVVAHHGYRMVVDHFLETCRNGSAVEPSAAGLMLAACASSERTHRNRPLVEPIWTGPARDSMPFRNTEQALIQVVDSAQEKLLIVSYAVYNIPNVASALVRAAERGVRIRVVIESTDPKAGKDEYSNLKALGAKVAGCASVYYWPVENRDCSPSGKPGIMHVKCAVADGETIFLSSANLTAQAFSINMELGVLVTSGNLANNVQERFGRLIKEGTIVAV